MSVDRFYKKDVLKKFNKNHRKTPVPESDACNFIKKRLWQGVFL